MVSAYPTWPVWPTWPTDDSWTQYPPFVPLYPEVDDHRAILSGRQWPEGRSDGDTVITFAINTQPESHWRAQWDVSPALASTFRPATAQEAMIRDAFYQWEKAGDIQLVQVAGNDAHINIGLFDFSVDPDFFDYSGYAWHPGSHLGINSIHGDIFIDYAERHEYGLWLQQIGHALGLEHPFEGDYRLEDRFDHTDYTVMSYTGPYQRDLGPLDKDAIAHIYGHDPIANKIISVYELQTGPPSQTLRQLRDYDGTLFPHKGDWKMLGFADIQLDGDDEFIFVNDTLGRWATIGPDGQGFIDFDNHGRGGDTRVVGVYIDPLVQAGVVAKGSDFDSQQRFAHDLKIDNLIHVGAGDFDHDGFQNLYFKTVDGTAYLNAQMHADGNIRYANYQSEWQMRDYIESHGWSPHVYDDWLFA